MYKYIYKTSMPKIILRMFIIKNDMFQEHPSRSSSSQDISSSGSISKSSHRRNHHHDNSNHVTGSTPNIASDLSSSSGRSSLAFGRQQLLNDTVYKFIISRKKKKLLTHSLTTKDISLVGHIKLNPIQYQLSSNDIFSISASL